MLDKIRPASLKAMTGRRNSGMRFGSLPVNSQSKRTLQPRTGNGPAFPAGRVVSDSPPAAKSNARHLKSPWRGEESNDYPHVVAVLNPGWRVIACKNSIQWILQNRRGSSWRSRFFFRTRSGLVAFAREYAGQIDGVALAILLRLPERIGGAS